MLTFSSVPLYNLFCKITGFGGTTNTAVTLPNTPGNKNITVSFNTDVAPGLNLTFKALTKNTTLRTGTNGIALFTIKNLDDKPMSIIATYNTVPHRAGSYFNKIECFCFDEITLDSKQEITLPVSFFLDPALEQDPYLKDTGQIILSYSFFNARS